MPGRHHLITSLLTAASHCPRDYVPLTIGEGDARESYTAGPNHHRTGAKGLSNKLVELKPLRLPACVGTTELGSIHINVHTGGVRANGGNPPSDNIRPSRLDCHPWTSATSQDQSTPSFEISSISEERREDGACITLLGARIFTARDRLPATGDGRRLPPYRVYK